MCFSPEADFVSGTVIGVVGVATLTKVESPGERALGVLPLAFALHQVVEGFVWLGLEGKVSRPVGDVAVNAYVAFAWVVLPFFFPLCVLLVERSKRRRRIMAPFVGLGAAVGSYLLGSMVVNGVSARIASDTIQYGGAGRYAVLATILYVVATCTPPLLSSHRAIVIFGALDLLAVGGIGWAQADGLTSVWCAWAAVVSILIYLQFVAWRQPGTPAAELLGARP